MLSSGEIQPLDERQGTGPGGSRQTPLFTRRSVLCGLLAALLAAGCATGYLATHQLTGLFNDFDFYWASARLLAEGRNPYDITAMRNVLGQFGLHPASTLGYSYPLLFAYLMVPISLLPPLLAAVVFSALSLAAYALAVALLLAPLDHLSWPELSILVCGAGTFAPVAGSLRMGQVNLLVLLLLTLAFRGARSSASLAMASAIKLYPIVGLLVFIAHGRGGRRQLLFGVSGFGVLVVLPNLLAGVHSTPLLNMFTPDAYYTNESINGFLSRLAGDMWHTAPALTPGLPVEPVMLLVAAVLGMLSFATVLLTKGRSWAGCLALLLGYAVIAAPRNSLWDFTPLLIVLAWCWPRVRRRPPLLALLLGGWGLIQLQQTVYDTGPQAQAGSAILGLLGSTALFGAIALAGLVGFLVLRESPQALRHNSWLR